MYVEATLVDWDPVVQGPGGAAGETGCLSKCVGIEELALKLTCFSDIVEFPPQLLRGSAAVSRAVSLRPAPTVPEMAVARLAEAVQDLGSGKVFIAIEGTTGLVNPGSSLPHRLTVRESAACCRTLPKPKERLDAADTIKASHA